MTTYIYYQFINARRNKNVDVTTIKYFIFHILNRHLDTYNSHLQEAYWSYKCWALEHVSKNIKLK